MIKDIAENAENIISDLYQIFRRRFYYLFRKKYIQESLARRKGGCNRCSCCEKKILGIKYRCRYYIAENKSCWVYKTPLMPKKCILYPFDEKDKWRDYKNRCGFYW